ncbi:MAG: OmpA family protein [Acidobacteriaceae bacterium]|nr:OmpA family protein [Acidobacteriaceae bacterium]MBV8569751.1 OmpA family protein [Acidobacteriaceae bacterium]
MKHLLGTRQLKAAIALSATALLASGMVFAAELNNKSFAENKKEKVKGVILSHEGSSFKVRADDDSICTIDVTDTTKVRFKHHSVTSESLVTGLYIEAKGKGNEKGELVATKVEFNSTSLTASRQADAIMEPVAARTGALETRATSLESRATASEDRQNKLDDQQKQTAQQVSQVSEHVNKVQTEADEANRGVDNVNQRVTELDNLQEKYSDVVYFRVNSSTLSAQDRQKLDNLAQQTKDEKGYSVMIIGYTDKTGSAAYNQHLSEARANAVIRYLQEKDNIPVYRIIRPAGMGATHEVADNNTSAGRKMNRRVEIKVMVNQGLTNGSNTSVGAATAKLPGSGAF